MVVNTKLNGGTKRNKIFILVAYDEINIVANKHLIDKLNEFILKLLLAKKRGSGGQGVHSWYSNVS